ncbi:family 4C encapsulin nanocompartment shell protein [Rubricoccus marinus]|uniref:Uncharacterized protein n=1 Tax=Rubricoccus marinus TaxID=716817 RepID=A0A259TZ71_9BACT|nr:family 4C encapsulin nanocompartment shell protein [Rubricoccus marinus]OZC03052.1 hypothetical protein BSZ36_08765 [Rubricoccus marinus]
MLILEASPETSDLLAFVDESVRNLQQSGAEPRTILVGPLAYERLREAVAARFGRENQHVEQVQWLSVVIDPGREDRICVLPTVRETADGARLETV